MKPSSNRTSNDENNLFDSDENFKVQQKRRRRLLLATLREPAMPNRRARKLKRPQVQGPAVMESNNTFKRPRRVTFGSSQTTSSNVQETCTISNDLWIDRYTPKTSSALVVATKKLDEVKHWMECHIRIKDRSNEKGTIASSSIYDGYPAPMLIIVGSPGIGKSTAVRCLASEVKYDVLEWTESLNNDEYGAYGVRYENPLNSFEQFLYKSGSHIKPLALQMVSPMTDVSNSISKPNSYNSKGKFVIIDELPNTHTVDAQQRLQQIITAHIRRPDTVPTIFIYSDTPEGKLQYDDLEKYIHSQTLYSKMLCQVIVINPPTKSKFRTALQPIIASECTTRKQSSFRYNNTYLDELYERSNGDLRFAITTLQYEMIGDCAGSTSDPYNRALSQQIAVTTGSNNQRRNQRRDTKLSPFHALGKLLYAKRTVPKVSVYRTTINNDMFSTRAPLEFDPDDVIRQSEMELGNILHFLSYHSADFYTEIEDLSSGLSYFSDSSFLSYNQSMSTTTSLTDIGTSLAGRVVAYTNKHPAPNTFKALSAPKVYDMIRKRRDNQERIEKYCQLQCSFPGNVSNIKRTNPYTFAVDLLPYIRAIVPDQTLGSSFLDSYFRTTPMNSMPQLNDVGSVDFDICNQNVEDSEFWKEQNEILNLDDIVEDLDHDNGW